MFPRYAAKTIQSKFLHGHAISQNTTDTQTIRNVQFTLS